VIIGPLWNDGLVTETPRGLIEDGAQPPLSDLPSSETATSDHDSLSAGELSPPVASPENQPPPGANHPENDSCATEPDTNDPSATSFPWSADLGPDPDVLLENESGFALVENINDTTRMINQAEAARLKDIAALYDTGAMDPQAPSATAQERTTRARWILTHLELAVLPEAIHKTPKQLHPFIRRAIHRLDPDFTDEQTTTELTTRRVTHRINPHDGTGDIHAHLGAAETLATYTILDAYARTARAAGSDRTLHELRADIFTHLIIHGHLPDNATPANTPTTPATSADPTIRTTAPTLADLADPADIDTTTETIVPDIDPHTGDIYHTFEPDHTHTDCSTTQPEPTSETRSDGSGYATENHATENTTPTTTTPTTTTPTPTAIPTTATAAHPRTTTNSGLRAHVEVVISLESLIGLTDDPADLKGYGPITARTARDLAFTKGSTWRRLVTDPLSGYLLNYGRTTYAPPKPLAQHCRARDYTCRTPNCDRPATKCDLDHIINWPAGDTSDTNLACDCKRCHRMKHEGRWTHHTSTHPDHPPGTVILTSPTGHIYLTYPHDYNELRPKLPPVQRVEPAIRTTVPAAAVDDPGPPPF
jgi:hypothetical protein